MKPFFRKSCIFAFAACLFFQLAPDRAQIAQAQIKTTHVAGAVHMLTGRGGNIGVSAGEDGILMVDDKFAPLAPKIKAALGGLGAKKPLAFVVNTHWHGDHTGANEIFGKDAYIISHANVRKRLAVTSYVLGRTVKPKAKVGLPVITYEGSISVHFNGEEIRIVHYPKRPHGRRQRALLPEIERRSYGGFVLFGPVSIRGFRQWGRRERPHEKHRQTHRADTERRQNHPRPRPALGNQRAQGVPCDALRDDPDRARTDEGGQNPRPDSGGGIASKIRKLGNGVYFDETLGRNGFQRPGRKEIRQGSS